MKKEKAIIIEMLIKSINKVQSHYYGINNPRRENGQIIGYARKRVFPERNFCTNLYLHFLKEMKSSDLDIGEKFFLDEEIYKKFSYGNNNDENFNKTREKLKISKTGMRPDLVLHASQQERNIEGQLLILECKIDPSLKEKEFYDDYFKLNYYKSELNFQNSVYLIVNNTKDKICTYLSNYNYKEKYWETPKGRVEILIKENYDSECINLISETSSLAG